MSENAAALQLAGADSAGGRREEGASVAKLSENPGCVARAAEPLPVLARRARELEAVMRPRGFATAPKIRSHEPLPAS